MLSWLVIGVGDITSKRVLPAILAEERSRLAGIVTRRSFSTAPSPSPPWQPKGMSCAKSPWP